MFFDFIFKFWGGETMFFGFLYAKPSRNYVKKSVLEAKRAKLNLKSEHGHVHHVPKAPSEGDMLQKTKDLSSWTGLGRSGHDRSQSFGKISYVSVPKLRF